MTWSSGQSLRWSPWKKVSESAITSSSPAPQVTLTDWMIERPQVTSNSNRGGMSEPSRMQ